MFPSKFWNKAKISALTFIQQNSGSVSTIRQEKETKRIQIRKEEINLSLFAVES